MEIYKQIRSDVLSFICLVALISIVYTACPYGRDDSDSKEERSGLAVRTDHKTGCQWLESHSGYLVPRVDASQKQICN